MQIVLKYSLGLAKIFCMEEKLMKLSQKLVTISTAALLGISPVLATAAPVMTVQAASQYYKTNGKNSTVKTVKKGYFVDKNGKKTSKAIPENGQYTIWEVKQIAGKWYYSIQTNMAYWMPASLTKGSVQYQDGKKLVTLTTDGKGKVTSSAKTATQTSKTTKTSKTSQKTTKKTTKASKSSKTTKTSAKLTVTNIVTIHKAQVYDQKGNPAKTYQGSKKWTVIGKGVEVKGLGTTTIKGEKYYALEPGHYYLKASDVKVK